MPRKGWRKPVPQMICEYCKASVPRKRNGGGSYAYARRFCSPACAYEQRKRDSEQRPYLDQHGYVIVFVNGRRVPEHRYVMETMLGRPLTSTETVHHRNGVRRDNRPDNLEVWLKGQPAGQRLEDRIDAAILLLEQHGYHLTPPQEARI